jgi:peptidoglycan/xylan/chitin deacetylase (PgdA/CDA1 family)
MVSAKALRKAASPMLYGTGTYRRGWQARARVRPFTVVLVYHRITAERSPRDGRFGIERGTPVDVFEAQLRFMRKRFAPIQASETLARSRPPLAFAVTLDDGYEDNLSIAAPVLERLGIPATFFVVSDFVGTDRLFWWERLAEIVRRTKVRSLDLAAVLPELAARGALPRSLSLDEASRANAYERLSAAIRADRHDAVETHMARLSAALEVAPRAEGRDYALMGWTQLRELVARGHEIGGHTATHCNVVGADAETLEREIVASQAEIERRLEAPVPTFAYPYGGYEPGAKHVSAALAKAGCRAAFTARKGVVVETEVPAFELPRATLNRRYPFACAFNVEEAVSQTEWTAA